MNPDWTALDSELDRWVAAGLRLPLWWRDDDAATQTAALDRLIELAGDLDLAVHLAVIPAKADDRLAATVARDNCLIPVMHGWAHRNRAPEGAKKAEFGAHRPAAEALDEAAQGLARLTDLFGACLVPLFVPPWNRIAPEVVQGLPGLGFAALSTFTPRTAPEAAPGLARVNTHLDPIDWKAGRGLVPPEALIAQVAGQLADRRTGRADNAEPYGILTHHLVHDDAIWTFTEALLRRLLAGPALLWTAAPMERDRPE